MLQGRSSVARHRGPALLALSTLALAVVLSGCSFFGNNGSPTSAHVPFQPGNQVPQKDSNLQIKQLLKPPSNPDYRVIIYHNDNTVGEFAPEQLTIPVGSVVEWYWTDQYDQHNVWWIDQNLVNSPTRGAGYRWAVKFLTPGVYDYYCTLHPGMLGRVVVTG